MENSKSNNSNTGYRGVQFTKENGKFRVRLALGKRHKTHHIGYYDTLKEAIKAREEFISSLY